MRPDETVVWNTCSICMTRQATSEARLRDGTWVRLCDEHADVELDIVARRVREET